MKKMRIGLIGCGMGRHHGRAAAECEGARLSAVAEPDNEKRDAFFSFAETDEVPVFDDYRKMILIPRFSSGIEPR